MRRVQNKTRLLIAALALVTLMLPQVARAFAPHQKREAREEIWALEGQWRTAQIANDVAAMDKLLADDYLGITPQGDVLTKAQQLERMRNRQLRVSNLIATDIKIKLVGKIAIVTSLAKIIGSNEGGELDGQYRYTRIYEHLPAGPWKITNFEITRVHDHHSHPPAN